MVLDPQISQDVDALRRRTRLTDLETVLVDLLETIEAGPYIGIKETEPYQQALTIAYQKWKYGAFFARGRESPERAENL